LSNTYKEEAMSEERSGILEPRHLGKAYDLIHRVTKGKRLRRWRVLDTGYTIWHGFTEVRVTLVHDKFPGWKWGMGFAKCKRTDRWNESVGIAVALSRAIRDALDIPQPKGVE